MIDAASVFTYSTESGSCNHVAPAFEAIREENDDDGQLEEPVEQFAHRLESRSVVVLCIHSGAGHRLGGLSPSGGSPALIGP